MGGGAFAGQPVQTKLLVEAGTCSVIAVVEPDPVNTFFPLPSAAPVAQKRAGYAHELTKRLSGDEFILHCPNTFVRFSPTDMSVVHDKRGCKPLISVNFSQLYVQLKAVFGARRKAILHCKLGCKLQCRMAMI